MTPEDTEVLVEEERPLYGPDPYFSDDELYNVRSIKLTNGNDIIAVILYVDEQTVIVKRPCQVIRMMTENGIYTTVGKWIPYAAFEQQFVINRDTVINYAKIESEMFGHYLSAVRGQINEECKVEDSTTYTWPDWMDHPNPTQIN
jgi:hypothetical protein